MLHKSNDSILYLVNKEGHCQSVQLSMELWSKVEEHVCKVAQTFKVEDDVFSKPEPLNALAELKEYWDFTYPYEAHVCCEACGAATDDFENDPNHPFHLTNANIGGLLVFKCICGATIRKKHFHKKVVFECTKP